MPPLPESLNRKSASAKSRRVSAGPFSSSTPTGNKTAIETINRLIRVEREILSAGGYGILATELAENCEISRQVVLRDLETLGSLGAPIKKQFIEGVRGYTHAYSRKAKPLFTSNIDAYNRMFKHARDA